MFSSPTFTGTATAPTFSGALSGNASSATTFSTGRTNYKTVTDASVAGQLMWKNYGNNHTIFDASAGTSPEGGAVNNTSAAIAWAATYPTLMGWNGASTYGVRVDSARIADGAPANDVYSWAKASTKPSYTKSEVGLGNVDNTADANKTVSSAGNATTAGGLAIETGRNNNANRIVRTDASGYIQCGYINSSSGDENNASNPSRVWGTNGSDSYLRTYQTGSLSVNYATTSRRLARSDSAVDTYNVQSHWDGVYWELKGYNDSTYHAGAKVAYATSAGSAPASDVYSWAKASVRPTYTATDVGLSNVGNYTVNQNVGTGNDVTHNTVTAAAFYYSSDATLKTNIGTLTNYWETLDALRPVSFDWISSGKKDLGLLAQDVQSVMPESVTTTDAGTLAISSSGIIANLVAAVKDLKRQVEELTKKLQG